MALWSAGANVVVVGAIAYNPAVQSVTNDMAIRLVASAIALLFLMVGTPRTTTPDSFGQALGSPVAATDQLRRTELQTVPPGFVAEPEDPTEIKFIAEPEDPELVWYPPVNGPIDVWHRNERASRVIVPDYERVP